MRSSRSGILVAGCCVAALAVGGCSDQGHNVASQSLPHNEVATVPERLVLAFPPGRSQLTVAAAREMTEFLDHAAVRKGDGVGVGVAGSGALDQQRRAAVADRLLSLGYKPAVTAVLQGGPVALGAGPVTVTAYRYVVTPPNCPDWSHDTHLDWKNQSGSNFGCSTENDLALMVANPRDLIQGQASTPALGETSGAAIERYRAGKVTPLRSTSLGS